MAAPAPLDWNAVQPHLHHVINLINANVDPLMLMNPQLQQIIDRLDALEANSAARFDALDDRLDALDTRFDALDTRIDALDARFDALDTRIDVLEAGSTARFNALDARLGAVEARLGVVEHRLVVVADRLGNLEARFGEAEERLGTGLRQVLARLPILITSANHNATWGSPIVYPLWFPGELLAELPRLKRDALVISGEHASDLLDLLGAPVDPNATEQEKVAAFCSWIGLT